MRDGIRPQNSNYLQARRDEIQPPSNIFSGCEIKYDLKILITFKGGEMEIGIQLPSNAFLGCEMEFDLNFLQS